MNNVLVNVKGRCDALRKDVGNVVIGVRTIVELGPEGALPFLGRDLAECIWGMKEGILRIGSSRTPSILGRTLNVRSP